MAHIGSIGTQKQAASAFINALATLTTSTAPLAAYAAKRAFSVPNWWTVPPAPRLISISTREMLAWWQVLASNYHKVSRFGFIAGIAKKDNQPIHNATIRLYYEPTGIMIEQQQTDILGAFRFDRLDHTAHDFQVIAQHETLNAQVFAHLTPTKA